MAKSNAPNFDYSKVIGGFEGEPIKGSMLGKSVKSRGLLSNNLPYRKAAGLTPYNEYGFLFPTGTEKGAVWRFSQSGEQYQDSAATLPVTAVGQTIGKQLDYTGNGNHLLQATSTARPLGVIESIGGWNQSVYSGRCDGVDDGMASAVIGAGTLTNNMDFFCAIKRNAAGTGILFSPATIGGIGLAVWNAADAVGLAVAGCGAANTVFVDGVQIGGVATTNRQQLEAALTLNAWHVLEIRNIDMSTWTQIFLSQYGGFIASVSVGDIVMCTAQVAANRALARTIVGASVGLNL